MIIGHYKTRLVLALFFLYVNRVNLPIFVKFILKTVGYGIIVYELYKNKN